MEYNKVSPQILIDYLNQLEADGKSDRTGIAYEQDLICLFRYLKLKRNNISFINKDEFNVITISDITYDFVKMITIQELSAFMNFCKNQLENEDSTRDHKVNAIKSFFKFLCDIIEVIDKNPANKLSNIKYTTKDPKYLTTEESKHLLTVVKNSNKKQFKERDYCIFMIFLNNALRLDELYQIQIPMIDFEKNQCTVIGKGNKPRTISFNQACVSAINRCIKEKDLYINKIDELNTDGKDSLFINRDYGRLNKTGIAKLVKKYLEKAGFDITEYHTHSLRHSSCTSQLIEGNANLPALQKFMGHASLSTTQRYMHITQAQVKEVVNNSPFNFEE